MMQRRSRAGEYRSGRSLLDRCDKLLHSIAAFTGAEQVAAADQQPSPVSVLDSSAFLAEEGSPSPSPLSKRSIDFKGDHRLSSFGQPGFVETKNDFVIRIFPDHAFYII